MLLLLALLASYAVAVPKVACKYVVACTLAAAGHEAAEETASSYAATGNGLCHRKLLEPEAQLTSDGKMFVAVVVTGGTIIISSSVVLGFGVAGSSIKV